jgi:hypothetical protein
MGAAAVLLFLVFAAVSLTAERLQAATTPAAPGAPEAQAAVAKPDGKIRVVAVAANPADPFVIQHTLGDGRAIQVGTTGLDNVPVGVPVTLEGRTTSPDNTIPVDKYAWTFLPPSASKATLSARDQQYVQFTPDVAGTYKVDVVLTNAGGAGTMASMQIRAGEYIGVEAGNCRDCHAKQVDEWEKTGHATIFREEINGLPDPASSHYGERCIRCHTTGYYPGANNGGFASVQEATGWQFPPIETIQSGADTWGSMPRALRNMGTIGCENCHGPAKEHVTKGAKMASTVESGTCNQCHNGGGTHIKGTEMQFAKHSHEESRSWWYPTGPSRQDCVRCHSAEGFPTFLANPTEPATWSNKAGALQCASCHDPHSDQNKFQLRIVGKPVNAVGIDKDFGLSATCVECHNARVPADAAPTGSTPHYSAAGEMLANTAGFTFGQALPNTPHGLIVGSAPVKDPTDQTGKAMLFGGAAPGPCAACHMWPTVPANSPNAAYRFQVGEHSFNAVSPDGQFQYLASCQSCHPGTTSLDSFVSKADYDGDGRREPAQAEVLGMMERLKEAIGAQGVAPLEARPYFDAAATARASGDVKAAIYNYLLVRGLAGMDGRAAAVHNYNRSIALLQVSYKQLMGRDVPGATSIMAPPVPPPTPTAAPSAQPTAVPQPPATASTGPDVAPEAARPAVASAIPHVLSGREQCSLCHTTGNLAMPVNHIGRSDASCTACHRPTT